MQAVVEQINKDEMRIQEPSQETGKINKIAKCSHCGSTNVFGMSRVVGYFSLINNWNTSKKAEFKSRQKGNYKLGVLKKDWS